MRWTSNIFTRSALAAGTAAILVVASGSTSSQASNKPGDLPIVCTTLDGLPIVSDLCNTVDSIVPDLPIPSVLPEVTLPPLPLDSLPLPDITAPATPDLTTPAAPSSSAAPSLADQIPTVIGEIVTILPP